MYGAPETQPITEAQEPAPGNPYGTSKLAAEAAIGYQAALGGITAVTLRTFNVAGAVDGHGDPDSSRIIPKTLLVAAGQADCLNVNGDGSAIREYVHVRDLARAYAAALDADDFAGHRIYNVGSGVGVSVREVIEVAERITGRPVPVRWGAASQRAARTAGRQQPHPDRPGMATQPIRPGDDRLRRVAGIEWLSSLTACDKQSHPLLALVRQLCRHGSATVPADRVDSHR